MRELASLGGSESKKFENERERESKRKRQSESSSVPSPKKKIIRARRFNNPPFFTISKTYDNATQCGLCIWCDSIRLVQNNNFKGRIGILAILVHVVIIITTTVIIILIFVGKKGAFLRRLVGTDGETRKVFDLVPHDGNSAFITGIKFQHSTTPLRRVPQLTAKGQGHRRLCGSETKRINTKRKGNKQRTQRTRNRVLAVQHFDKVMQNTHVFVTHLSTSRGPIEQHMRQPSRLYDVFQRSNDFRLMRNIP